MRRHLMPFAAFLMQPDPPAFALGVVVFDAHGDDDRDGDELWTYDGRHVGHFHGHQVFASDGRYLGELRGDDRLITRTRKPLRSRGKFTPIPARPARPRFRGFGSFAARG